MTLINILEKTGIALIILTIFTIGWTSNNVYDDLNGLNLEKPLYTSLLGQNKPKDALSPQNHIEESQIHVYEDKIVIDIENVNWARFADTNSMDPLIDIGANSFEIVPQNTKDINTGDIISYSYENQVIVHRVVKIGEDEQGWFAVTKGDNLTQPDREKVRFNQIEGILVGIIY